MYMDDDYIKNLIYQIGTAIDSADPESAEVRLLYRLHDMILELYYENERNLAKN